MIKSRFSAIKCQIFISWQKILEQKAGSCSDDGFQLRLNFLRHQGGEFSWLKRWSFWIASDAVVDWFLVAHWRKHLVHLLRWKFLTCIGCLVDNWWAVAIPRGCTDRLLDCSFVWRSCNCVLMFVLMCNCVLMLTSDWCLRGNPHFSLVSLAKYFWEKVHTGQIKYLYGWYCQVFLEKYTPVKYKYLYGWYCQDWCLIGREGEGDARATEGFSRRRVIDECAYCQYRCWGQVHTIDW